MSIWQNFVNLTELSIWQNFVNLTEFYQFDRTDWSHFSKTRVLTVACLHEVLLEVVLLSVLTFSWQMLNFTDHHSVTWRNEFEHKFTSSPVSPDNVFWKLTLFENYAGESHFQFEASWLGRENPISAKSHLVVKNLQSFWAPD